MTKPNSNTEPDSHSPEDLDAFYQGMQLPALKKSKAEVAFELEVAADDIAHAREVIERAENWELELSVIQRAIDEHAFFTGAAGIKEFKNITPAIRRYELSDEALNHWLQLTTESGLITAPRPQDYASSDPMFRIILDEEPSDELIEDVWVLSLLQAEVTLSKYVDAKHHYDTTERTGPFGYIIMKPQYHFPFYLNQHNILWVRGLQDEETKKWTFGGIVTSLHDSVKSRSDVEYLSLTDALQDAYHKLNPVVKEKSWIQRILGR